jgi:hypothetical protein
MSAPDGIPEFDPDDSCPELTACLAKGDQACQDLAEHCVEMGAGAMSRSVAITTPEGMYMVTISAQIQHLAGEKGFRA